MTIKASKIEFRNGTHNPYTIYVTGPLYRGMATPGWMKENEAFLGSLPDENLAKLAVTALNALVCLACSWGCPSCTLDESDCECYEHGDDHPDDAPAGNA